MGTSKNKTTKKKIDLKFRDWRKCMHERTIFYIRTKRNVQYEFETCLDCGLDVRRRISAIKI